MMKELYAGIFLFFGGIVIGVMSFMMITGCETLDPIFHKFDMNSIFFAIGFIMSMCCLIYGSHLIVSSLGWYII